jgi:hypothetical protein
MVACEAPGGICAEPGRSADYDDGEIHANGETGESAESRETDEDREAAQANEGAIAPVKANITLI